jgi:hypothetical protein
LPIGGQNVSTSYHEIIISVSACRHSLAIQEEAIDPLHIFEASPTRRLLQCGTHNEKGTMSNKQRLTVYCFRLEVVHAMRTAYRMACEEPRLKDVGDGMTEIVAEKILELAEAGETDPERLCSGALRKLSH